MQLVSLSPPFVSNHHRGCLLFDIGSFLEPCTWCVIEVSAGVISVCLPTFWPLLVQAGKYVPSRFSTKVSKASDVTPRHIVTIGGGKRFFSGKSSDKSVDARGLDSHDVTLIRLDTQDDAVSPSNSTYGKGYD